jgi:hypothetical protein
MDSSGAVSAPAQVLLPDLRRFRLLEAATYTWRHESRSYRLVVPAGFEHDFASVPRPLWALISPIDLGLASMFHDWLYRNRGRVTTLQWDAAAERWTPRKDPWIRRDADRLFARIMREQGVARWRRRLAFRVVRVVGGRYWRSGGPARGSVTPPV